MPGDDSILEIDSAWRRGVEDMGSKPKFWFWHRDAMWLFKQARPNTGEHWAEKIASEIAGLLKLPTHAVVLARYEGRMGCAVRSFLQPGQSLIHGNELLAGAIEGYDKSKQRGQSDHNFANIVAALERHFAVPKVLQVVSARFVGYLILDALVGNTDRHHENWGAVQKVAVNLDPETKHLSISVRMGLAPTFDHGSSLGRELLEDRARQLAGEPDALRRYIRNATGGIFRDSQAAKGLSPMAVVELIAQNYPTLFKPWREHVAALPPDFARPLLDGIPASCMSQASRDFALAFLRETRSSIESIP